LRKLIKAHRVNPDTGKVAPEAMVSVVCIGAVLLAAGELMFAWTCTPNVHWIWPLIAGSECEQLQHDRSSDPLSCSSVWLR
jgi:hypothetical protein